MPKPDRTGKTAFKVSDSNALTIPASVNWVTAGNYVNAVKNQGQCGSCWAFATTASMESAHAILQGTLFSLSEQQLVSCSSAYGNAGCGGGWYYWGWDYAAVTPIASEAAYPYKSGNFGITGTCKYVSGSGLFYDLT